MNFLLSIKKPPLPIDMTIIEKGKSRESLAVQVNCKVSVAEAGW